MSGVGGRLKVGGVCKRTKASRGGWSWTLRHCTICTSHASGTHTLCASAAERTGLAARPSLVATLISSIFAPAIMN